MTHDNEELVSVVIDYRIEWRHPEGRQDAIDLLLLNERSRELQAARRIEESTPYVQLAKTLQTMWERLK